MAWELVEFVESTIDIAFNLKSNNVGVVLMGDSLMLQEGSLVKAIWRISPMLVSEAYLGCVINALAKLIDEKDDISPSKSQLIEWPAPMFFTSFKIDFCIRSLRGFHPPRLDHY